MSGVSDLTQRLEMLLVLRWLYEGADEDGVLVVSVSEIAESLDLGTQRRDMLAVMAALGDLEERRLAAVSWPGGQAREVSVRLSEDLRRDARKLFGR